MLGVWRGFTVVNWNSRQLTGKIGEAMRVWRRVRGHADPRGRVRTAVVALRAGPVKWAVWEAWPTRQQGQEERIWGQMETCLQESLAARMSTEAWGTLRGGGRRMFFFKIKERRCLWFAVENGVGEERISDIGKRGGLLREGRRRSNVKWRWSSWARLGHSTGEENKMQKLRLIGWRKLPWWFLLSR